MSYFKEKGRPDGSPLLMGVGRVGFGEAAGALAKNPWPSPQTISFFVGADLCVGPGGGHAGPPLHQTPIELQVLPR